MTDIEVKMIKAELNQMAAKDKFSNICESALRLINLYEAIILGNQMEIAELKKENEELRKNQIVWHNPDELPPVYENSSLSINVLIENGVYVEYDFDAHHWIIAGTNRKIIIKKWTDSFPSSCK